jgi:Uma2 family endonuclease
MAALVTKYTISEYFEREVQAETKNEYIDGEIVPMTGGTPNHNTLVVNLLSLLYAALRGYPYRIFVTDQRLWIPNKRIATYPDLMVVAEPLAYQEGRKDTLINPISIVEVLSPSTAGYDRGDKFAAYRTISTFKEYLLVAQDRMYIEHFQKHGDRWIFSAYEDDTTISVMEAKAAIATTAIYSRVDF